MPEDAVRRSPSRDGLLRDMAAELHRPEIDDGFQQAVFRSVGKKTAEVFADALERFGGRAFCAERTVQRFGCRVSCDAPAVAVVVPVDAVLEIGDDQPLFHLQPRQNRVERDFPLFRDFRRRVGRRAFSASSGESQHPAQLPDGGRSFCQDGLQHHVVEGCRILVRCQRPGTAAVRKIGQPLAADEPRLACEEFAVGAVSFAFGKVKTIHRTGRKLLT